MKNITVNPSITKNTIKTKNTFISMIEKGNLMCLEYAQMVQSKRIHRESRILGMVKLEG